MSLWIAGVYFLIYYLLAISIARVRAEVGPPTNEVSATPHLFLYGCIWQSPAVARHPDHDPALYDV